MAGAMRKVALYLGLVEDEDRYGAYDDDYDDRDEFRHSEPSAWWRNRRAHC